MVKFPIIDGKMKYQDFSRNIRDATIINLASDRSILQYLEEELEKKLKDIKSESQRAYNLIKELERIDEKKSSNVQEANNKGDLG